MSGRGRCYLSPVWKDEPCLSLALPFGPLTPLGRSASPGNILAGSSLSQASRRFFGNSLGCQDHRTERPWEGGWRAGW